MNTALPIRNTKNKNGRQRMDLLSKWNQRIREEALPLSQGTGVAEMVKDLLQYNLKVWWSCGRSLPAFKVTYLPGEQAQKEKQLEKLANGLITELKHIPPEAGQRKAWQERLRPGMIDFARSALNLEQRHLEFIESSGMMEASQEFARMARQFDPNIKAEDIYQAARNVMTMNFIQLLAGLPVEVTPSVFAYSMLYPYTDNYLDDPTVSPTTKLAFNHRFQRRLQGEEVRPANANEATISQLVGMIEGQWDRARYPQVYESLLAIHAAQARSLELVAPGASPYDLDVLGISFEKGGTSVLADGYLVAGTLTPEQARLVFGYGAFTQLMDDLEDIQQDQREGRMTLFSQTARQWPLDGLTNHFFHFGRVLFEDMSAFHSQSASALAELIAISIDPVLIDTVGRAGKYYSKEYLRELERHLAFRFAPLQKQREKLSRQKIGAGSLIESML